MKRRIGASIQFVRQFWRRKRLRITDSTIRIDKAVDVARYDRLELGSGCRLHDYVRIRGRVVLGENTHLRSHCVLNSEDGLITLGDNCSINEFCVLNGKGGITIGNDVRIAAHTTIFSSNHVFDDPNRPIREQGMTLAPVEIGDDVWLGAGVRIVAGVTIGRGTVVGAGSVVSRSLPDYSVAVGVPAKVISRRSRET